MNTNNLKLKRITLIGAVIMTITASSCQREDYFYEIDDAPLFMWNSHTNQIAPAYLLDTIKIWHQQTYEFSCSDIHIQNPVLTISDTTGNFEYEISDGLLKLEVQNVGTVQGTFTATDIYGKSSQLFFKINTFFNKKPIAKGEAQLVKILNDYEIEIDLSQSFDSDSKQGGCIEQYEYKITSPSDNIYNVVTPLSKISYIFKEKGVATIEFRVCDNDGEWSEWETTYIKI